MDINKLINSLSDESKKELLEKLAQLEDNSSAIEAPPDKSFKRKRRRKNEPPKVAQPDRPRTKAKSKAAGPVTNVEHINLFDTSGFKNQERDITRNFDSKVKKSVTPRGDRSTLIEIQCSDCNKNFTISNQLLKHDGDEYYYVCNRCMKNRR